MKLTIFDKKAHYIMRRMLWRKIQPEISQKNLVGVVSPICLLKCQSALDMLKQGDVMEVMVQDLEVVCNLQKIIVRFVNQVIKTERNDEYFQIFIRRGTIVGKV
ncbi:sulfurtransferase TusA family protein [Desulfococcaceae bacterium HSG9]|nr:sulfurtransferase TusA family protein [Desulfococcaceae bacterium HSG9]